MKAESGFRRRITGAFGDSGSAWLDSLPSLVESYKKRWSLSRVEPFPDLSYAWVARVRRSDGPAVLKVSVPGVESRSEILALKAFPADIVCRLYEADPEACAILIEDLMPGSTLHTVGSFDERVEIGRTIFARLHDHVHGAPERRDLTAFPSFAVLATKALSHVATDLPRDTASADGWGPRLRAVVRRAFERLKKLDATTLGGTTINDTLVHGDLHHGNILSSAAGWKVIDPKGIAGPLWLEPARFMLNQYEAASVEQRPAQFDRMSESFARALGVRPDLVALGTVLDAAVSACWSWEDGAGEKELLRAVERAETIGVFATRRRV